MLYFIGNHNTIILLQDEKGRFYKAAVNAGRRLVLNRDRYPLLKDFSLQNELIELPDLEVRQHPGGGELWLYDAKRGGDVRDVGTRNNAFIYSPGWTSLCPTCAGYDVFDMSRAIASKGIPGWEWICHEDGSGHLRSPAGDQYCSYDLHPITGIVEYKELNGKLNTFEATGEKKNILRDFRCFAENYVKEHLFA